MSNVTTFKFNDMPVRVVEKDGEKLFVIRDICNILGFSNPNRQLAIHTENKPLYERINTPGGLQVVRLVPREDVEKILASSPSRGGDLNSDNVQVLKYCTKVKYLDLGHNDDINDISFVSYMPDLEVFIIAINTGYSHCISVINCYSLAFLKKSNDATTSKIIFAYLLLIRILNYCVLYFIIAVDISYFYFSSCGKCTNLF